MAHGDRDGVGSYLTVKLVGSAWRVDSIHQIEIAHFIGMLPPTVKRQSIGSKQAVSLQAVNTLGPSILSNSRSAHNGADKH